MEDKKEFIDWEDAVLWLREQADQQELVYDAYYDDPLTKSAQRYWHSAEWQEIKSLLQNKSGTALDVGAGRGIASFALTKEGFSVTALEPDDSEIVGAGAIQKLAKDSSISIDIKQSFSESLPCLNNEFDIVFARAVLHHTQDLSKACEEYFRVLKPGGKLIAIREHVISRQEDLPGFFEIHPLHKLYGGENAFLLKKYLHSIKQAGFVIEKVLKPFESPINYSPHTIDTLKQLFSKKFDVVPGAGKVMRCLFKSEWFFNIFLKYVSFFDSRPGRLYSFVATKPLDYK